MSKNKNKKKKTNTLNKSSMILLIVCLLIFCVIAFLVVTENIAWLDNSVYSLVSKMICEPVTKVFKTITLFCETEVILIILALLILFIKNKKVASLIAVNAGLCVLLNQVVKKIFLRARPVGTALIKQGGYSFPSGHSMMALAFYGLFIYLVYKSNMAKNKKIILISLLSLLIFLVGLSRIYLGVHFASDVIAGFALSLAYLIIFIKFIYTKKEN